jgi:UDP-glucose 4-epimerase
MADLTVAVTGPTGDIGRAFLRALEHCDEVGRVIGMARSPFDPAEAGLAKAEYRQGDILDRPSVDALVDGADVVVHLAFIIMGDRDEARQVNLEGSRNVFEAAVAAGSVERLVYTSSVAAYGFHSDNPQPLSEDVEPRGSDALYYSAHKAELETALSEIVAGSETAAYVFRPPIVAGVDALTLVEATVRTLEVGGRLPFLYRALQELPFLAPVLPDPGNPFQVCHHDDVARALVAAVEGRGEAGVYNLAAPGELRIRDLAAALGWYSVPIPNAVVDALAEAMARIPFLPSEAAWIHTVRVPVLMDASKARRQLDWEPESDAASTLQEMAEAARLAGVLR